jgi:hypothetical protein
MTKKDFELIASAVRASKRNGVPVESYLAAMLADTNPRFDEARFLAACKVTK